MVKDFTKVSMDTDLSEIFRTINFWGKKYKTGTNGESILLEMSTCLFERRFSA